MANSKSDRTVSVDDVQNGAGWKKLIKTIDVNDEAALKRLISEIPLSEILRLYELNEARKRRKKRRTK